MKDLERKMLLRKRTKWGGCVPVNMEELTALKTYLIRSLLEQPVVAEKWDEEAAAARWAAGGRCDLCDGSPPATKMGLWTLTPALGRIRRERGEAPLPVLNICTGCWLFLASLPTWEILIKRLAKLLWLIEGTEKQRKVPILPPVPALFRKHWDVFLTENTSHGHAATTRTTWKRGKDRWTVQKERHAPGDDGESEL